MANDITLGDKQPIDNYLKPIKVGGKASPIEMASAYPDESVDPKVKIDGDLEITGDLKVQGQGDNIITSFTTGEGVDIKTTEDGGAVLYFAGSGGISLSFLPNSDTMTIGVNQAGTTQRGTVELATTAETTTGTDTERAVTPDGLKDGYEGSTNVTTLGTITSGTWEGTAIAHAQIGNDAIDGDNIADDSVNSEHYVDGSIDTDHIADDQVTYAKIQDVSATDRILGRDSAGAGVIEEITPANLRTMINVEDGATADQTQADINGLAITTTGALDSGSITSGFGAIDNGTSSLDTGDITADHLQVIGGTLTTSSSDDNLLFLRQQLNAGSGENSGMVIENYSMFKTYLNDTDSAGWDNVYHINCLTGATRQFSVTNDGKVTTGGNITVGDNLYIANDKKLYLGAEANNDYIYSDGSQINIALDDSDTLQIRDAQIRSEVPFLIQEAAAATTDVAGKGQLWVKNDTPNNLYFTNDAGNDVQITNGSSLAGGSGGTSRWSHSCGGYKNNNNTTNYYFQYYPNRYFWGNAESSPTSVSYTDLYAAEWTAPVAGTLTKIDAIVRASGAADDCTFYVYKASPSVGGNGTTSLTLIGDSGSCGISATTQSFYKSAAISSSNTFSAGDLLFVMFKKDSTSASTQHTFSVTISGEYS